MTALPLPNRQALPEKKNLIYALASIKFILWYNALLNVAVEVSLRNGVNLDIYIDQTDKLSIRDFPVNAYYLQCN